ncbi:iron transporter [Anoxybacter fermentans]|uniref:Iron transporter n=1 Tax=Anoxybacter fermentans TaxID=1323375 RepID=A0A3Q9HQY2_9FIRM|nr:iron ABC transporter permease [Anoxybacter fermentans]AZR73776.1 iron transporter [Anoxybacter fermentans]
MNKIDKIKSIVKQVWGNPRPAISLILLNLLLGILMLIPLVYVFLRSLQAGPKLWFKLISSYLSELIINTITLTLVVSVLAISIGVLMSWLVVGTNLPGRKIWQWILALPLVIPPYVGALSYIILFRPRGWIYQLIGHSILPIYSFWGAVIVLTIFTYPYVYIITSSSLKKINQSYIEVGRSFGMKPFTIFLKIILPLIKPAIGAGGFLIALYVLSDFGAVAMLRYKTFSSAIYYQLTGKFDRSGAAILSTVLIFFTMIFLYLENRSRKGQKFFQNQGTYRKFKPFDLGKWKIIALFLVGSVAFLGVGIPLSILTYWSISGIKAGILNSRFFSYIFNTFLVAGSAALISTVAAIPVSFLKSRYPSPLSSSVTRFAYTGYILPGVIVALGIIFIFNQYLPYFYGTPLMLLIAYIIRFLPLSLRSIESSLALISPRIDEAAKSMGVSPLKMIFQVILPLIFPGLMAGGALVFVSSIKELPATLILRPAGFDTLAVRVWLEASEGFYELAAPAALIIILISVIPLKYLLKQK